MYLPVGVLSAMHLQFLIAVLILTSQLVSILKALLGLLGVVLKSFVPII